MRDEIISAIRRLAELSGGTPPGSRMFQAQTGIRESTWRGVYWARWGDAVDEAGFQRNAKGSKIEQDRLMSKLAEACRRFGRIPTAMELRLYRKSDATFPGQKTVSSHFGTLSEAPRRLADWAKPLLYR
jgi:hypothetical protein